MDRHLARLIPFERNNRFLPRLYCGDVLFPNLSRRSIAAAFLFRSRNIGRRQFLSIDSNSVVTEGFALCVGIRVWILPPPLDWKKEILLHLRSGVVHAITNVDGCVLRVQIDLQRLVFDRDVGVPVVLRGAGITRLWNSCLPGATIGEEG